MRMMMMMKVKMNLVVEMIVTRLMMTMTMMMMWVPFLFDVSARMHVLVCSLNRIFCVYWGVGMLKHI